MQKDLCFKCKNYFGDLSCMAFKEIPEEILVGDNDHSEPLPGQDNDIVFEAKEGDGE